MVWKEKGTQLSAVAPVVILQVQSLGLEDPLQRKMATHPSILPWKIHGTKKSGGLQSMGSQKSQIQLSD